MPPNSLLYIDEMYVRPEARGQGIGTSLVSYLDDSSRELGFIDRGSGLVFGIKRVHHRDNLSPVMQIVHDCKERRHDSHPAVGAFGADFMER